MQTGKVLILFRFVQHVAHDCLLNRSDDSTDYFSDFYAYHINTNTWNKLYVDIAHPLAANPDIQSVKSRINHSMLYDDVS